MVGVIVKEQPAPEELTDWLATVPGFLEGLTSVDDRPTELYDYQIALMTSPSRFRAVLKSRQTGLSFAMAAEAIAKAHLKRDHTSIFVSYNLRDAVEKIRHADMLYDSLPARWKKRRVTDNKTSLEFEDGRGRRTRLISLPCRDPRGYGQADVNLDEMPFMRDGRRIYTAAVPIISRGGGTLTLGSTPLGKGDQFYEILEGEPEKYPAYQRIRVAWWDCPEFCTNVPAARLLAPSMTTDQRVERFGTQSLKDIRASLDLDSFQQEYELAFMDALVAFIPWELIQAATRDEGDLRVVRVAATRPDEINVDEILAALDAISITGPLTAGYDVGRRRNASELIMLEQVGTRYRERLHVTLPQTDFELQESLLLALLAQRPDVYRLCIDETGIGMQLAEKVVSRFSHRAEGVTFSAPVKSQMAHQLKIDFEGKNLEIAADRALMLQIHSVRKTVTVAGNIRLDTEHDDKHHCYDAATEILTDGGWFPIAQVTTEHRVATLDGDALTFEHPTETQSFSYQGDMVRVKNKQVDLLVTPNHRMYVRHPKWSGFEFMAAEDLVKWPGVRWHYRKDAQWTGDDAPSVPMGTAEQYARFLGWYLSEGCKASQYRVLLYQNAGPVADAMISTLEAMGRKTFVTPTECGALRIECYSKVLHGALPDGLCDAKRIPRDVLGWSPRLLRIVLDALMDGDGSRTGSNWSYWTTSPGLADDLTELLLRCGWSGSPTLVTNMRGGRNIRPLWRVNINRTRVQPVTNHRRPSHTVEPYDGQVYCVTVPSHVVYVRRNGIAAWCGNSDMFWALALARHAAATKAPPPASAESAPARGGYHAERRRVL